MQIAKTLVCLSFITWSFLIRVRAPLMKMSYSPTPSTITVLIHLRDHLRDDLMADGTGGSTSFVEPGYVESSGAQEGANHSFTDYAQQPAVKQTRRQAFMDRSWHSD